MPKSTNQKLKILYLQQILLENTDNDHCITMEEILTKLSQNGIEAERKSIYDDIEQLNSFGMDIICQKGKNGGYFVANRDFELPELKLLVDTVQSAKFITEKKSNELIKKLENLASRYEAQELQNEVYVANRIKTMNESIYRLVDRIALAINTNRKITFYYLEWTLDKTRVPRNGGKLYKVSPQILTWDDENYYMIAHDESSGKMKHYRVDKMQNITVTDEKREGSDVKIDVASFSKKVFGMFGGSEETVTLECANSMIGIILDRFGTDIRIIKNGDTFKTKVNVMVSPQFYAWVVSLGGEVKITAPTEIKNEFIKFVKKSIK